MGATHTLAPGYLLTVTAGDAPTSVKQSEDTSIGAVIPALASRTFGPYFVPRTFTVGEGATVLKTAAGLSLLLGGALLLNAGAPVTAVAASLTVNPAGDDNGLTFTARNYGAEGNRITIEYRDPGTNNATLSVSVSGDTIVVNLATGAAGAVTSTAAEVLAAVNASVAASRLVSVAIHAADTGVADDGSGVVTAMAAAPLTGGTGTAINVALPGAVCIDYTNGATYTNTGTTASPVWTASVTTAAYAATAATVNALAALHLYGAGAPVDYTDGTPPATGEGAAPKGAIYSDTANGLVYRNSGTQAQPIWTKLGDAVV